MQAETTPSKGRGEARAPLSLLGTGNWKLQTGRNYPIDLPTLCALIGRWHDTNVGKLLLLGKKTRE